MIRGWKFVCIMLTVLVISNNVTDIAYAMDDLQEDIKYTEAEEANEIFELKSIAMDKTTADAPTLVEVTAVVSGEMAGGSIIISLENEQGYRIPVYLEETNGNKDMENLTFKGVCEVTINSQIGVYKVQNINTLNSSNVLEDFTIGDENIAVAEDISLTINNENLEDITPPVVTDIQIDKHNVSGGEIATIYVTAEDELSGVSRLNCRMRVENEKGEYSFVSFASVDRNWDKIVHKNVFAGKFAIDKDVESGNYHISEIYIEDNMGNGITYYPNLPKKDQDEYTKNLKFDEEIKVKNEFLDKSPFDIASDNLNLKSPDVLNFTATSSKTFENFESMCVNFTNGVGENNGAVFYDKYWDEESNAYKDLPENTYSGKLEISKYLPPGTYSAYSLSAWIDGELLYFVCPDIAFTVENENKPIDINAIYEESPELAVEKIKETPDNSQILLSPNLNHTVPAEIFDTIKNTSKTIILSESDWKDSYMEVIFKGEDIKKSYPVNTWHVFDSIDNFYTRDPYYDMDAVNHISELVNGKETAILMFMENGDLPGKATIRTNFSYDIKNTLGTKNLYVYKYDPVNKQLIPIAEDISLGEDGYLEFDIDSLQTYVITKGSINE